MIFLPALSPRFTERPGTCPQRPSSPGLWSSLVTHSSLTSSALTPFSLFPLDNLFPCYNRDCSALEAFSSDILVPKTLSLTLPPSPSLQTSVRHPLLHSSYSLVFSPFNPICFLRCLVRVPWEFLLLTLLIPFTPNIQLQPFPSLLGENGITLVYSTYYLQYLVFSWALSFGLFLNSHRPPFSFLRDTQFWVTPVGDRFGGHVYCALGTSFSGNTPAPTPALPQMFGKGWTFDTEPQWADLLTIGPSDFLSTVCSYII